MRAILFLLVVVRTDKIHYERRDAVDLQDGVPFALRKVPHLGSGREKPSGGDFFERSVVPLRSHANGRFALHHGHVFRRGMPVRSDLESVCARESQGIGASGGHGIALDYGDA